MTIQEKLRILQKISGLTQTELAGKVGVSFVAFNNWWNDKAKPRKKQVLVIDELYKEYTGQKQIPESILSAKKGLICSESGKHKNVLKEIIDNPDIHAEFLLSLTYNSNKIEGSTLSENETANIMFNKVVIKDKSLIEHLEVQNHQTALLFLFQSLMNKKEINEALMLKLHLILMNGIKSDAGNYRRHGVRIMGAYVPTANYLKIPELMKELSVNLNKQIKDIIGHVSLVHSRFEQIHPFSDGNGRIGRLIMVAMLLKNNIAPAIIEQAKKQLYYTYLNKSQLKNDHSQLEDFICEAILLGFKVVNREK